MLVHEKAARGSSRFRRCGGESGKAGATFQGTPILLHHSCSGFSATNAMDPLSIIASIIAILQAGGTVGGGLKRLISLRNAPAVLLQLNNDVTDLQLLIHTVAKLPRSLLEGELISAALKKVTDVTTELEGLIQHLTKVATNSSVVRVASRKYLLAENKILESRSRIADARLSLVIATNVTNG